MRPSGALFTNGCIATDCLSLNHLRPQVPSVCGTRVQRTLASVRFCNSLVRYAPAMFCLSNCICSANNTSLHCEESVQLLQQAVAQDASLDHVWYCLAMCHLHGEGVQKNAEEGVRLLRIAADMHNPAAQTSLGVSYFRGIGVEMDFAAAVHWLQQGARQGNEDAGMYLEEIAGTALIDRRDVLHSSLAHFSVVEDEDLVEYYDACLCRVSRVACVTCSNQVSTAHRVQGRSWSGRRRLVQRLDFASHTATILPAAIPSRHRKGLRHTPPAP
jgi:hypothetical protein